ncbi:MAG: LPS assembly lipoprotein LptE [Candidatus Omnitrophota bacterium]
MTHWRKRVVALLVTSYSLLVTIFGCGYTTRSMISDKYRTIYVAPFANKVDITNESYASGKYRVYRPMLDSDITKSVRNKFLLDGNLRPASEETADLILKGELIEFRRDPLRYDDSGEVVSEYRLNLVCNLSLLEGDENRLVWEEKGFTGDTTYFTSGFQAKSEDTAVNDALSDLARRIVERTVEQW